MIHLDFETRSFADLRKVGAHAYAAHETTQLICAAYAFDGEEVIPYRPWLQCPGEGGNEEIVELDPSYTRTKVVRGRFFPCPDNLRKRVESGEQIAAFNAAFECVIWEMLEERHGWPHVEPEQWVCVMAAAHYNGLPGGLDQVAKLLGMGGKQSQRTLMKLTKPRPTWLRKGTGDPWFGTAEEVESVVQYNIQDVAIERAVMGACPALSPRERSIYLLDQKINTRGIPIDMDLVEAANKVVGQVQKSACADLDVITHGDVTSPSQVARIMEWLDRQGYGIPNMQKGTVDSTLGWSDLTADVRRVFEIRQSAGGAAVKKYLAFADRQVGGRVFGELMYYGAHTGRWSSRGIQLQNVVKNRMKVSDAEALIPRVLDGSIFKHADRDNALTTLVRAVICAEPGNTFVDLDFNAIEARVLAWLAGEESLLEDFRQGRDPYVRMAAHIYGCPEDKVTKEMRALGKVAILGLGYGMGVSRFFDTCGEWGIPISLGLAEKTVTLYRRMFPKIVQFWSNLEDAIDKAMRTGDAEYSVFRIKYRGEVLAIYLPSGRPLVYHQCKTIDGSIEYFGRRPNGSYGQVHSWGGKFTENVDSSIARDLLASAMLRIEEIPGVEVLLTLHDELLMQVPKDADLFRILESEMEKTPVWAAGLPVAAEGWVGKRFRKE